MPELIIFGKNLKNKVKIHIQSLGIFVLIKLVTNGYYTKPRNLAMIKLFTQCLEYLKLTENVKFGPDTFGSFFHQSLRRN